MTLETCVGFRYINHKYLSLLVNNYFLLFEFLFSLKTYLRRHNAGSFLQTLLPFCFLSVRSLNFTTPSQKVVLIFLIFDKKILSVSLVPSQTLMRGPLGVSRDRVAPPSGRIYINIQTKISG